RLARSAVTENFKSGRGQKLQCVLETSTAGFALLLIESLADLGGRSALGIRPGGDPPAEGPGEALCGALRRHEALNYVFAKAPHLLPVRRLAVLFRRSVARHRQANGR